MLKLKAKF